ncbi:dihydropteroate synthase [Georgenia faecalis]|uniref:Dihydropteroate synthase n=1 Tax=Georgenia faecalis TaxID=2483799 RepID=A0ABV9DBQ6_9MICO|nr:dihydropteroate synthase [Georgenia faecalis]
MPTATTPPPTGRRVPTAGRTLVMGVVNVTPDSFSDGGWWPDPDAALVHARALRAQGADILDVGGESTRPGAERVPGDVELARVLPVVAALAGEGACVSVDTLNARTALACVEAGAALVNDVSGGLADPEMAHAVASTDATYVLGHWRGDPTRMTSLARYDDVVADVVAELGERVEAVLRAGMAPERIVLDPGLGFAKEGVDNWRLLARLDAIAALGFPVLVGASRKRFLGALLAGVDGVPAAPLARDHATAAVTALAAGAGAWAVRVHDVPASADAVRVAAAWAAGGEHP